MLEQPRQFIEAMALAASPVLLGLTDALLIIAHDPQVACVKAPAAMSRSFPGTGARLVQTLQPHG
jgi:hypothetical protein